MLNIPSTVVDPNYRYKMPKMQIKIESKGNGIKTNIVNLADVAKYLRTNESYILKFFGFEKASQTTEKVSQTKSNKQGKSNTSYIIQGDFPEGELLKVLDKFIDKYILCPKCKLPEMHLFIDKDRISGKCDSCPFNGEIDNKHKLAAFILKNPPEYKPQASKRNVQKITKIEKGAKKEEQTGENIGQKVEEGEEDEDEKQEAEKKAVDLFSSDTIEFPSEELDELIEYTKKFVMDRKEKDFDLACAQIVADLKPIGLKKPIYAYVLFNTFFTINIAKQIKTYGPRYIHLMKKLGVKELKNVSKEEAEEAKTRGMEIETMLNIEYLFMEVKEAHKEQGFSKRISTVLMILLQNKLFSEDFLRCWSKKDIKDLDKMFMYNEERDQKFKEYAKDFVDFINDNDDDEEQDEDDN